MNNRYRTEEFEQSLIKACNESPSMLAAAASLNMHFNTFKTHAVRLGVYKPNQAGKSIPKNAPRIPTQDILNGLHPHYHTFKLKNRLIEEKYKPHQCENCSLTEWCGNPIPLELHHIDGDRSNHLEVNLQLLCPNCHSLTPTFRGKSRN